MALAGLLGSPSVGQNVFAEIDFASRFGLAIVSGGMFLSFAILVQVRGCKRLVVDLFDGGASGVQVESLTGTEDLEEDEFSGGSAMILFRCTRVLFGFIFSILFYLYAVACGVFFRAEGFLLSLHCFGICGYFIHKQIASKIEGNALSMRGANVMRRVDLLSNRLWLLSVLNFNFCLVLAASFYISMKFVDFAVNPVTLSVLASILFISGRKVVSSHGLWSRFYPMVSDDPDLIFKFRNFGK